MKFKVLVVLLALAVLGGGGYAVRTYLHNADPAVKAERLEAEGKLRDALVELRNASRDKPRDPELHLRIAQVQSKLADPVAAEKEFRIALAVGADRDAVTPQLGESILVQGRFRDVLREIPARGPNPAVLANNLLLRAVAQLSLQDLPAAEATLAQGQAQAPGQADVALIAARVAAARDDPKLMAAKVAEVLKLDPAQVEALLMQEKILTLAGDRPGALGMAERAVKAAPWSAMARIERANQLIYAGDDKRAQDDVNAILSAQPRFIDAVYLNGILMARRGQLAEAAAQLERLDSVSARIPQGLYYQSLIALRQGNTQTAAEFARRYSALVPEDPDGLRQLARTELALDRPSNALAPLQKLMLQPTKDADVYDMLGRAYASTGRLGEAATAFSTASALAPDDNLIRYHQGVQQLQSSRYADAAATLGKAFETDPKLPGCGQALVSALLGTNEIGKAEAVVSKMREAGGETADLGMMLGSIRQRQGDLSGARTVLTETARKFPNVADIRVQLAQVLVQQGQTSEALTLLLAVLAKEPAQTAALNTYIQLKANENDLPAAIKVLESARQSAPRNAALTSMLADALTANNEAPRAIRMLRDTGADSALPPMLAGALGRAQTAAGRFDDARATYAAVLKETPKDLVVRGLYTALLTSEKAFPEARASLEQALAIEPANYSLMSGLVANEARWKGVDAAAALADEIRARPGSMPFAAALKGDLYMQANRPADAARAYLAEYTPAPIFPLMLKAVGALAASGQDDAASGVLTTWLAGHPKDAEAAQRLAQLDLKAGRMKEAQEHLGIVLERDPTNVLALNNLAWAYSVTNDKRALPTAQRAYLQGPNATTGDTLAWILVKDGSARAAVPLLQRAAGLRPADLSIQYHLAVALSDDNRRTEALAVLAPLATGPAFEEQAAARKLQADLSRN